MEIGDRYDVADRALAYQRNQHPADYGYDIATRITAGWIAGYRAAELDYTNREERSLTVQPDYTGAEAVGRDETDGSSALAVWLSEHGAVWIDEDGEISIRSRYTGCYVADWHGHAIVSAQRWYDTNAPVSVGDTITGERAQNTPSGTVLARVGDNGRVIPGCPVIEKDNGFTASLTRRYRVLELARGAAR